MTFCVSPQIVLSPLSTTVFVVFVTIIEIRIFVLDPFDECLDVLILEQSWNCVVVVEQLSLREHRVDLVMTNAMYSHCFLSTERLRDQVVVVVAIA